MCGEPLTSLLLPTISLAFAVAATDWFAIKCSGECCQAQRKIVDMTIGYRMGVAIGDTAFKERICYPGCNC